MRKNKYTFNDFMAISGGRVERKMGIAAIETRGRGEPGRRSFRIGCFLMSELKLRYLKGGGEATKSSGTQLRVGQPRRDFVFS